MRGPDRWQRRQSPDFVPGRSRGGEVKDLMESCLDGLGPQMAQVQCCRLPTPPLTGNPAPGGQKVHRRPGSTDGPGPQTARVHRQPRSTDGPGPHPARWGWPKKWCIWTGWRWPKTSWVILRLFAHVAALRGLLALGRRIKNNLLKFHVYSCQV